MQDFLSMLAEDGKKNSLGRVDEVIELVLADKSRLGELYSILSSKDAWVRMRAIDAIEKIARNHPDWITPYIDTMQIDLSESKQASIKWHLAQLYAEVPLTDQQKARAIEWLKTTLSSHDIDWIVSANVMNTLAHFVTKGDVEPSALRNLLTIQRQHKSPAVVRRAEKLLKEFS